MSRLLSFSLFNKIALTALFLLPVSALQTHAAEATGYFTNDIDDAVEAVKRNPKNTNHIGSRWYGRSTSRSISLPPLLNTEMDQEVIEGAMGPTAAGEAAAAEAQQPSRDAALGRKNNLSSIEDVKSDQNRIQSSAPRDSVGTNEYIFKKDFEYRNSQFGDSVIRDVHGSTIQRSYHHD